MAAPTLIRKGTEAVTRPNDPRLHGVLQGVQRLNAWMLLALCIIGLCACTSSDKDADDGTLVGYDHSADVSLMGWSVYDTLCFPLEVAPQPEHRSPIALATDYDLWCNVRHDASYPYQQLPLTFVVQLTDTTGSTNGTPRVVRNVLRSSLVLPLRQADGRPLGTTWGSLIQHEVVADSVTVRFDSAGMYRMLLIPDAPAGQPLKGVASVGISLRRAR